MDSRATNHVTEDHTNIYNKSEYGGGKKLIIGNGRGLLINNNGHFFN